MFVRWQVLAPEVIVLLLVGPVMEVGVKAWAHAVLLGEWRAVLLTFSLLLGMVTLVEQQVMLVVVYGDLVLTTDGHGATLLHHIVPIQQWIGRGACIWVPVVPVQAPVIVLAVHQHVLVATRINFLARGIFLGLLFYCSIFDIKVKLGYRFLVLI